MAGARVAGYNGDGRTATSAQLNNPLALLLDASGNLYIADSGNNLVRKIDPTTGNISLVAGSVVSGTPVSGYTGDNGPAVGAALSNPTGLMFQPGNNGNGLQLCINDTGNSAIRGIDPTSGNISTIVSGAAIYGLAAINEGGIGLNASHTQVKEVGGETLDFGAAYMAGGSGQVPSAPSPTSTTITAQLMVQQAMTISSIAIPSAYLGTGAPGAGYTLGTMTASGCTVNPTTGAATVSSSGCTISIPITWAPQRPGVRRAPLVITYSTGSGTQTDSFGMTGYGMGPQLGVPGSISQMANFSGGPANISSSNGTLTGATYSSSNYIYVTTGGNHTVWMYNNHNPSSGYQTYTRIAGQSGSGGYGGDNGPATSAQLNNPSGVTEDPAGNLYIADTNNCRIRMINVGGYITTAVGNGTCSYGGDGGDAGSATTTESPEGDLRRRSGQHFLFG